MTWILRTPVCTFSILHRRGKFELYADDDFLQSADNPDSPADNVYTHSSEFDPWDQSDFDCDDSLSGWTLCR